MPKEDAKLIGAKRSYHSAKAEGNRQEEARWANVIGDILKNRGEYVEALKWLRIDYEVSSKYLSEKQLLPTCQSLGEVFLRLGNFKDALIYQKKHLELAKDANDLVEQQRASTQLGRTYHEMFSRSADDQYAIRNAKKYFRSAMNLAKSLKEKPPNNNSSFLKEYIDAHNNIGMLELDLDNFDEAEEVLTKGLEICDEEEVAEDDDGRSRLHHNLGNVYLERRMWNKAKEHIEKDIIICQRIGHCQGEAKGYINLGELHYRKQKYDEASQCYQKALKLAKSLQDEDSLVEQINGNMATVREAIKVMDDLKSEEQNLKKLERNLMAARGTTSERKCLLQQNKSLDCLIEKAVLLGAWQKHLEFAKRKKRIASELCDKEKLSDSYLEIGESYRKLRNFSKALKWYNKSWEMYKSIGNMEGQAIAKINIGDVLDCDGKWGDALNAFEEGYRISVEASLPSRQLSALENMHYSHMIRFGNIEEARRLQHLIEELKCKNEKTEDQCMREDICSETDTEENDNLSDHRSGACSSPVISASNAVEPMSENSIEELNDDVPLISFLHSNKSSSKLKAAAAVEKPNIPLNHIASSPKSGSKSSAREQRAVGRKRVRLVLSDDEDEVYPTAENSEGRPCKYFTEGVGTTEASGSKNKESKTFAACTNKDVSAVAPKCTSSSCSPVNLEESTCSYKSYRSNKIASQNGKEKRSVSNGQNDIQYQASDKNYEQCITLQIDNDLAQIEVASLLSGSKTSLQYVKAQLACLYYLQLPTERRLKGLLPIIQQMKSGGRILECSKGVGSLKDMFDKGMVEVSVSGWIQKPLMKLYVDSCYELSEPPNLKLLTSLYNLEVSEDEVIASDCELQDVSITPLLNAMNAQGTIALLNLSHNLLGNGTMEKLQQIFKSSGQQYGDLCLDLHCNRFGPTALFQICQCSVLFDRLVVLNISGNRLTDTCGSYLSAILKNCKALYSLNIEHCCITSRTIQKVTDALDVTSMLSQLYIGHNDSVSGIAIVNLLSKLTTMRRFSELSLSGLKLTKPVADSLCQLARSLSLSGLMLGGTNIGTDGALQLSESLSCWNQELVKFDLSCCGLSSQYFSNLTTNVPLYCGILELNLGGNTINQEGVRAMAEMLKHPQCCMRVMVLNKCQLGFSGVLQIIQASAESSSLKELNLADNVDLAGTCNLQSQPSNPERSLNFAVTKELYSEENMPCILNHEYDQLEVADSEDEDIGLEQHDASGLDHSYASSCKKVPVPQCPITEKLSAAISLVRQLEILDLSDNKFSLEAMESFYAAWRDSRIGSAERHIDGQTVHFSVSDNRCCRLRPCCRRD